MPTSHLDALNLRLSNERVRLSQAKTKNEIELRTVWVQGIEKEIKSEIEFLKSKGIEVFTSIDDIPDDDALLAELLS